MTSICVLWNILAHTYIFTNMLFLAKFSFSILFFLLLSHVDFPLASFSPSSFLGCGTNWVCTLFCSPASYLTSLILSQCSLAEFSYVSITWKMILFFSNFGITFFFLLPNCWLGTPSTVWNKLMRRSLSQSWATRKLCTVTTD